MRLSKRTLVLLGVMVVAIAASIGAYAYFTTTGSGTGSATTGSSSAVTIYGSTASTLYPGTSSVENFTLDNPSPGHQYVTKIHFVNATGASITSGNCLAADYSMPDVTVNQDFPTGNGQTVTATGTVSYANNGDQDLCQGKTVTLNFTSS